LPALDLRAVFLAQTVANAALTQRDSIGFKVSVVVVDRDGSRCQITRGRTLTK
jgi:hypothetical protein